MFSNFIFLLSLFFLFILLLKACFPLFYRHLKSMSKTSFTLLVKKPVKEKGYLWTLWGYYLIFAALISGGIIFFRPNEVSLLEAFLTLLFLWLPVAFGMRFIKYYDVPRNLGEQINIFSISCKLKRADDKIIVIKWIL